MEINTWSQELQYKSCDFSFNSCFFIYLWPWFICWRLSSPWAAWLPVFNIISACLVPYSWCRELNLIFLGEYFLRKGKFSCEKVSLFFNLGLFSDSENGVPKLILLSYENRFFKHRCFKRVKHIVSDVHLQTKLYISTKIRIKIWHSENSKVYRLFSLRSLVSKEKNNQDNDRSIKKHV